MEEKTLKNISCFVVENEEVWHGKIIFEKDGHFKGIVNEDFCASYISGVIAGDVINFSLIHSDNTDDLFSFKETGKLNNYKYYDGVWNNTMGKIEKCYLSIESIDMDVSKDIKTLEKKIDNFNQRKKTN